MLTMKVCHACDKVLGELEIDDLTRSQGDSIINVVGNVAYVYCPDCMSELEQSSFNSNVFIN